MSTRSRARLLAIPLVWLPALVAAWLFVSTRDLARTWHELQTGHRLTWPPPAHHGSGADVLGIIGRFGSDALVPAVVGAVGVGVALFVSRAVHRHRRVRCIARWELRLGRDDLANPYRVQEAFEGIAGAIAVRWCRRLWRGPEHLALEVHRMPDASIRFVVAGPRHVEPAVRGPLEDLYPNVELVEVAGEPNWGEHVVRLKKRAPFVLSIQTTRNYEHAFSESLVSMLSTVEREVTVQLVLTPATASIQRRARRQLKHRERGLQRADKHDPEELGVSSVVEAKELKGALELQHRTLYLFDLRVTGRRLLEVRRVAGLFSQLRSENELRCREMRLRRALYARRVARGASNPLASRRAGVLSTSELATVWQLPRARVRNARLLRSSVRRAVAPPEIDRDARRLLMCDEHGPVSLAPADRKYGHALIGGQGGGKSSAIARHFINDTRDPGRAVILIDPKGALAQLCLGLAPRDRTVHYLDLGRPEMGVNPLAIDASPGARAAVFLQALIEANPPGAIQAASDSFLRQAVSAVCTVEPNPTLWHVYRMLGIGESSYRSQIVAALKQLDGNGFAKTYWAREFPALLADRGFAAQALNPPRNKIERLISTHEIDTLLRHPVALRLDEIIQRGEVLIVAGAKSAVGEDNTILVAHLLLQLLHRELQAHQQTSVSGPAQPVVSLLIDEAHNVLTPSVARMLAEGRSAGLEAVFAWQYSAQIRDEVIRSGVRSLLQSISIFRMREIEDARSFAGLAMEVYSDRITVEQDEQERLRFSPDDILRLPAHQAINLWVADGVPRAGFLAHTLPMEPLRDEATAAAHRDAQHARGAHHPHPLPTLHTEQDPDTDPAAGTAVTPSGTPRTRRPNPDSHRGQMRLSDDVESLGS